MGVDPYLPEDSIKYSTCLRALSGFAGRVKTGYFGHGREVGTGTVSAALTAIGQKISMDRKHNPLKMDGSDKLLHPLAVMMSGLKKWDKPTEKKMPVEVDVCELLCQLGQLDVATSDDEVLGDWVLVAFYYLLRVGEYTQKNTRNNTKQTVAFRLKDITFFKRDHRGRLKKLSKKATEAEVMNACAATLRLSNQKNGWKNVCIFHFANGDGIYCPVRALGRRVVHLRQNKAKSDTHLSAYYEEGEIRHLTDKMVREALKMAAEELDYPSRNIEIWQVDTHSLRAGGANALALNGYSSRDIQKMGRWRGETFMEYIRENLSQFSEGMSAKMKKTFQFVNIQGEEDSEDGEVIDMSADLVNTPYDEETRSSPTIVPP